MSTKNILFISYEFVENIKINFVGKFCIVHRSNLTIF